MQHGNTHGSVTSSEAGFIALGKMIMPADAYDVRQVGLILFAGLHGLLECAICHDRADDRDCSILLALM